MSGAVHADAPVTRAKDTYAPPGDRAVEALKSIVREYYDESILLMWFMMKTRVVFQPI
jgi:hypothetical protein